jgi:hypothetical protein
VGKPVVRSELVHRIVRGHISTEIKARINAIDNKCKVYCICHAPQYDSSAQHFFPFHDLCSTVCVILFYFVHVNVAAEGQCAISRVRTDGERSAVSAISQRKDVTVSVGGSWVTTGSVATFRNTYKI